MTKEDLVQLPSGAAVAFQEYGDANGVPVVFCHGWPSSCTMARLTDEPARELGVRIISPDRPGISGSSLAARSKIGRLAARCRTSSWPPGYWGISDACNFRRRALCIRNGHSNAEPGPGNCNRMRRDSHGRTRRCQGVAATLPLDAGASSIATATLAKVVLYGAADSCIAAACPPSAVTFEDVDVATMRC